MNKARQNRTLPDELSACGISLLLSEPFYAHVLGALEKQETDQIDTLAVTIRERRPVLLVNTDFFLGTLQHDLERVAVLKHELLHLVFKHLLRPLFKEDPHVFNIAADIVVNQYVEGDRTLGARYHWKLPAGAVTLQSFPDLALEPFREVEYYFEMLRNSSSASSGAGVSVSDIVVGPGRHDPWQYASGKPPDEGSVSDVTGQIASQQIDKLLRTAKDRCSPRQWGLLPGDVATMIEATLSRGPSVDWKRALRLFAASAGRTYVKTTMKRPSKRYGTYPGTRLRRTSRLAVAIDTSGSVDNATLKAFFREIHHIWRTGVAVLVVEADAEVQTAYTYSGKPPQSVVGRGGTNFDPVMEWVRKRRSRDIDGLIYLTDGYASPPEVHPGCRILWVLSPDGTSEHTRFGRVIKLQGA